MANAIDAENALNACNNSVIDGTQVRVSYAMPGRPGASILHPKVCINFLQSILVSRNTRGPSNISSYLKFLVLSVFF